jgi:signal transduction histidine kinase
LIGRVLPWHIYAWAFISGIIWLFSRPAYKVILTEVVPRDEVRSAVALNSTSESITTTTVNLAGSVDVAQPYRGTDVAALVLLVLALLYAGLWLRDRERGMQWFAPGFALGAAFYFRGAWSQPADTYILPLWWGQLPSLATMCITMGMLAHLGLLPGRRRLWLWLLLAPSVVHFALNLVAISGIALVPRVVHTLFIVLPYLGMGMLAMGAARREPGAGHAWIGLALLSVFGAALVASLLRADSLAVRYWGVLVVMAFGLTLLTVALMRRRRALEAEVRRRAAAEVALAETNASLEAEVVRRTADLHQLVDGLESFNRSVSHDLRGPLGGIANASQLAADALRKGDSHTAQRMLDAIEVQARLSTSLVDALLQLARVADVPLHPQRVDLSEMARSVIEQVRLSSADRPFPQVRLAAGMQARADPALLRAVLTNLVGNAVKFTRERQDGSIEIDAQPAGNEVEVVVRDNGVGFDPKREAELFEPFKRLHGAVFEGHGVGLSIVRRGTPDER